MDNKLMFSAYKRALYLIISIFIFSISSCKNSEEKIKSESIKKGEKLFTTVGCATCHSLTNTKLYGPSLHNILDTKINVIRNNKEYAIVVDRNYIKKSIVDPDYEKPVSFKSNKMPKPSLTNDEVDCIVNYLISINSKPL